MGCLAESFIRRRSRPAGLSMAFTRTSCLLIATAIASGCGTPQNGSAADSASDAEAAVTQHCYRVTIQGGAAQAARRLDMPRLFQLLPEPAPDAEYNMVALPSEPPGVYSRDAAVWRVIADSLEIQYWGVRNSASLRLVRDDDEYAGVVLTFGGRSRSEVTWDVRAKPAICLEPMNADSEAARRFMGMPASRQT